MTIAPTQKTTPPTATTNGAHVPPLHNGDHLDADEFERRYWAMPDVKKAELIGGIVYMPSPVSFDGHAEQHGHVMGWLFLYRAATPGIRLGDNGTVRLDQQNEPQPDAFLLIEPERGGRTQNQGGYVVGGPELVCEIAASSVSIDRNAKMQAYRDNGVCEYVLWRTEDRAIDWFALRDGQYQPMPVGADGIVRSEVFPGLWLDVEAMLAANLPGVMNALQRGVATPEHAAFVRRLAESS